MNWKKCLVVVLLGLGCAVAARAQAGVYLEYSAEKLSGIHCFDPQGQCSSAGGVVNPAGVLGGAYYDFKKVGPVLLGLDFRGGYQKSNKSAVSSQGGNNATRSTSALFGVRGSVKTPITWLKPYAQVSAGYARSDATEPCTLVSTGLPSGAVCTGIPYDNFIQYEAFTGVNVKLLSFFDLRAVELGIGNMNRVGGGQTGSTSSVLVRSIGVGLVFHMP
jgi:hypothetical protein